MSNVAMYEELEAGISLMLMGDTAGWQQASQNQTEDQSDVREMLAIAAELRRLPRAEFRTRLATELTWQAAGRPTTPSRAFARKQAGVLPTILSLLTANEHSGMFPTQSRSMAASAALHAVLACIAMISFVTYKTVRIAPLPATNSIELTTYVPDHGITAPSGGGGGDASKILASGGSAPRFASE